MNLLKPSSDLQSTQIERSFTKIGHNLFENLVLNGELWIRAADHIFHCTRMADRLPANFRHVPDNTYPVVRQQRSNLSGFNAASYIVPGRNATVFNWFFFTQLMVKLFSVLHKNVETPAKSFSDLHTRCLHISPKCCCDLFCANFSLWISFKLKISFDYSGKCRLVGEWSSSAIGALYQLSEVLTSPYVWSGFSISYSIENAITS